MALQELAQLSEQSLTVRSKFTPLKTWLIKWKKESSRPLLFGRILKPSHSRIFMEKWISLVEASHANPFQLLDKETAIQTQGTYSHSSSKESLIADLPLFSWKMSEDSLAQSSNQITGQIPKGLQYCSTSSESWSESVTSHIGAYSQREKQACPILGKECLSLEKERILQMGISKPVLSIDTFKTVDTQSLTRDTIAWTKTKPIRIRAHLELTAKESYYSDLLKELEALKISNPTAFADLAGEIDGNNSMSQEEPCEEELTEPKNWATPITTEPITLKDQDPSWKSIKLTNQVYWDHKDMIKEMTEPKEWRTPQQRDFYDISRSKEYIAKDQMRENYQNNIAFQVLSSPIEQENWATPNAAMGEKSYHAMSTAYLEKRIQDHRQIDLGMQIQMDAKGWLTPTSRDYKDLGVSHHTMNSILANGHQPRLAFQAQLSEEEDKRYLNPRWVEMLMGLPIGWTMRDCVSPILPLWMKFDYSGME